MAPSSNVKTEARLVDKFTNVAMSFGVAGRMLVLLRTVATNQLLQIVKIRKNATKYLDAVTALFAKLIFDGKVNELENINSLNFHIFFFKRLRF